jgi:hypothetical protein
MKTTKRSVVDQFEKLLAQLTATHLEISSLSKKSANNGVNEFKLKLINNLLGQCNSFFGSTYLPFDDFIQFSSDAIPTNSDVSFVVAQYLECAEKFRADHIHLFGGKWFWNDQKEAGGVRTSPPKKLLKDTR